MNNGNSSTKQPGLLDPLNDDELIRLERALDAVGPRWGIAARLMSRMGLRVGEVAKLRWRHFELYPWEQAAIRITADITKTGYARTLPIPSSLTELLIEQRHHAMQAWQENCRTAEELERVTPFLDGAVIGRSGQRPLGVRWFQIVITKTAKAALSRRIKPHALRHTFATRLLKQTNIRVVQAALGHRSLKSTQIYTHPTQEDLRAAMEAASEERKDTP